MTLHEGLTPHPKQELSRDLSLASFDLMKGTANNMDLYFTGALPDPKPVQRYFASETLPLIRRARNGFDTEVGRITRRRNIDPIDQQRQQWLARPYKDNPDPDDIEAFNSFLVTCAWLPKIATHELLQMGFSRRGLLAPPFTTREYMLRLGELHAQVSAIANGDIRPHTPVESTNALWRSDLFFKAARIIAYQMKEDPHKTRQRMNDTVRRLLEGVTVDL